MTWALWPRKYSEPAPTAATLIGLDLNATRLRCMAGPAHEPPRPLPIDPPHADWPLVAHFEKRSMDVGRDGLAILRRIPHLTAQGLLAQIGSKPDASQMRAGIDPQLFLKRVAERLHGRLPASSAIALALPSYMSASQTKAVLEGFEQGRLNVLGSAPAPLLAGALMPKSFTTAAVIDADDHALTMTALAAVGSKLRIAGSWAFPRLNTRAWLDRMLNAVADRCIRLCRRDPRDNAAAEQMLFDQIAAAMDRPSTATPTDLSIRTERWYQELPVTAEDYEAFTAPLARQSLEAYADLFSPGRKSTGLGADPDRIVIMHGAAKLPGLVRGFESAVDMPVLTVGAEWISQAAWNLAQSLQNGDLPRGPIEGWLPCMDEPKPMSRTGTDSDATRYRSPAIAPRDVLPRNDRPV